MSDAHFRLVERLIREHRGEEGGAGLRADPRDLEQLAALCEGAIGLDDLEEETLGRLIRALGIDGVTGLLAPDEALGMAAGRTEEDAPPGEEAASIAFAQGWPDLDLRLAAAFRAPIVVPAPNAGAPADLPVDLRRAAEAEDVVVEAALWTPAAGETPILVHRFRRPREAISRAWSFYLPASDNHSTSVLPLGLWGPEADGGFRFEVVVQRRRSGELALGVPDHAGALCRLWVDPDGAGIARAGFGLSAEGEWRPERIEGIGVLSVGAWTERQSAAVRRLHGHLTAG